MSKSGDSGVSARGSSASTGREMNDTGSAPTQAEAEKEAGGVILQKELEEQVSGGREFDNFGNDPQQEAKEKFGEIKEPEKPKEPEQQRKNEPKSITDPPAVRPVSERINELEAAGFKRWQKSGMDRMYIDARALGLKLEYYNTGNIKNATFQGSHISNSEARRMLGAKTYIDVKTGQVNSTNSALKYAAAERAGMMLS